MLEFFLLVLLGTATIVACELLEGHPILRGCIVMLAINIGRLI